MKVSVAGPLLRPTSPSIFGETKVSTTSSCVLNRNLSPWNFIPLSLFYSLGHTNLIWPHPHERWRWSRQHFFCTGNTSISSIHSDTGSNSSNLMTVVFPVVHVPVRQHDLQISYADLQLFPDSVPWMTIPLFSHFSLSKMQINWTGWSRKKRECFLHLKHW